MGEEKNVLDVAKLRTNRYAFEVTANLENFLLYNPAEDEAMRIVNITNAILSWFLLSFGLWTYSVFDTIFLYGKENGGSCDFLDSNY